MDDLKNWFAGFIATTKGKLICAVVVIVIIGALAGHGV
jgi:hypothetical protein